MKRLILGLTVVLFLIGLTACGGGKYADAEDFMNKSIEANEKFAAAAEKVENVDGAVAVIEDFANSMKGLMPKMKEILEKYPEFKDPTKMPEELKALNAKGDEAAKKMQAAMTKLSQTYMQDAKFQAAMMKMGQVMTEAMGNQ